MTVLGINFSSAIWSRQSHLATHIQSECSGRCDCFGIDKEKPGFAHMATETNFMKITILNWLDSSLYYFSSSQIDRFFFIKNTSFRFGLIIFIILLEKWSKVNYPNRRRKRRRRRERTKRVMQLSRNISFILYICR